MYIDIPKKNTYSVHLSADHGLSLQHPSTYIFNINLNVPTSTHVRFVSSVTGRVLFGKFFYYWKNYKLEFFSGLLGSRNK